MHIERIDVIPVPQDESRYVVSISDGASFVLLSNAVQSYRNFREVLLSCFQLAFELPECRDQDDEHANAIFHRWMQGMMKRASDGVGHG